MYRELGLSLKVYMKGCMKFERGAESDIVSELCLSFFVSLMSLRKVFLYMRFESELMGWKCGLYCV